MPVNEPVVMRVQEVPIGTILIIQGFLYKPVLKISLSEFVCINNIGKLEVLTLNQKFMVSIILISGVQ